MIKHPFQHKLIVFEGIDGTGKTSTSQKLVERLNYQAEEAQKAFLDEETIRLVRRKIGRTVSQDLLLPRLQRLRHGGAIKIDDLPFDNPTNKVKKRALEELDGIDYAAFIFALSAKYKDRAILALLPYAHVVCDRYIYSLIAKQEVLGSNYGVIDYQKLDITQPDLFYQLQVDETARMGRIMARENPTQADLLAKTPGSTPYQIEKSIERFSPTVINNTDLDQNIVVARILEDIDHSVNVFSRQTEDSKQVFDTEKYLEKQIAAIKEKAAEVPDGGNLYIEFGGKIIDDQHAARVLPGYHPNTKIELLKELSGEFEVVVVVSARDILRPRIRGDSQLFYNRETIRLVHGLRNNNIPVQHGIVTMIRSRYSVKDAERLEQFFQSSEHELGVTFARHLHIRKYPHPSILDEKPFSSNSRVSKSKKHILVVSPGGGSGKFGVCLSELFHDFQEGKNSTYIKFETFPIYNLSLEHPLNLAFMAASSDLGNTLLSEGATGYTTYDKDQENFLLLQKLLAISGANFPNNPMHDYHFPSDMGVNKLICGITDLSKVAPHSIKEIERRLKRYQEEVAISLEAKDTVFKVQAILDSLKPSHDLQKYKKP